MLSRLLLFALLSMVTTSCYVLTLGYHQVALLSTRQDLTEVVNSSDTSTQLREKLQLVVDILDFAKHQQLAVDDAYSKYIEVDRQAISYVVFAAETDRLKLVQWWYPIVGDLPYRGYFDVVSRDQHAEKLAEQGYDVWLSDVDAYSSLGWFSDPVYSTMLDRRLSSLAHLLFHELVHRTYWLKDHSDFNESIAEFVAYLMTSDYLLARNLPNEADYYRQRWRDRKQYQLWLSSLRDDLQQLYSGKHQPDDRKKLFNKHLNNRPQFEAVDFIGNRPWNNARVLVSKMYNIDLKKFSRVYSCLTQRQNFPTTGSFLAFLEQQDLTDEPLTKFYRLCE